VGTRRLDGFAPAHRRCFDHRNKENIMQVQHQPASHVFSIALVGLLQRTEALFQRRIEARERAADLQGIEVRESTWSEWEETSASWHEAEAPIT
jgi:hypothetical protein